MSDRRTLPSLSYLKPLPTLQLLCLQTSYRVQFIRRHSGFILNAGFNILCTSCLLYYDPPAIIIFMFYSPIHTMLVVKFGVGLGERVLHFMYTVFKGEDMG